MISSSEMIRIRRQMQRRIHDVVAERRRARQMDDHPSDHTEPAHSEPLAPTP
ncbi:hypothetical protein [Micromonospora mirobrigensis]|uniref:Uncharacterized protein n=1 Tax=Micromonospora mirobrigensis TaxID=262898 RepID=A0A1C4XWF6_9ACTN|nr:hypothetical protein [Micromonospora mirobrigensis]SCF12843.1 hypothetical protein GA0070564_103387 [Micromonospora mirobrigensis]